MREVCVWRGGRGGGGERQLGEGASRCVCVVVVGRDGRGSGRAAHHAAESRTGRLQGQPLARTRSSPTPRPTPPFRAGGPTLQRRPRPSNSLLDASHTSSGRPPAATTRWNISLYAGGLGCSASLRARARACVCVRARVRACGRACVRAREPARIPSPTPHPRLPARARSESLIRSPPSESAPVRPCWAAAGGMSLRPFSPLPMRARAKASSHGGTRRNGRQIGGRGVWWTGRTRIAAAVGIRRRGTCSSRSRTAPISVAAEPPGPPPVGGDSEPTGRRWLPAGRRSPAAFERFGGASARYRPTIAPAAPPRRRACARAGPGRARDRGPAVVDEEGQGVELPVEGLRVAGGVARQQLLLVVPEDLGQAGEERARLGWSRSIVARSVDSGCVASSVCGPGQSLGALC